MNKNFIIILIVLSILFGCKKEGPTGPEPEDWSYPSNTSKIGISIYCNKQNIPISSNFDVIVIFYNLNSFWGTALEINYTSDKIEITDILSGPYFPSDTTVIVLKKIENSRVSYGVISKLGIGKTVSGSGIICKLKCHTKQTGNCTFSINSQKLEIRDTNGNMISNFSSLLIENLNIIIQ